jgi:hypothetical protein
MKTADLTVEQRLERLEALFPDGRPVTDAQIRFVLEDIQDRACKSGLLDQYGGLVQFTDFLRGLYPELYN